MARDAGPLCLVPLSGEHKRWGGPLPRLTPSIPLFSLFLHSLCYAAAVGSFPGIEYDYGISPKFVCTPIPPEADPSCYSPPSVPHGPSSNGHSNGHDSGSRRGMMSDEAKTTILHLRESLVRQKETILDQRETIRELTAKLTLCEGFGGHPSIGNHNNHRDNNRDNHRDNHHDDHRGNHGPGSHHPSPSSPHHGPTSHHNGDPLYAHGNGNHRPDPHARKETSYSKHSSFSVEQTGKTLQALKERLENLQARNSSSSYSSSLRDLLQRKINALEEQLHNYHRGPHDYGQRNDHHGTGHHDDHHGTGHREDHHDDHQGAGHHDDHRGNNQHGNNQHGNSHRGNGQHSDHHDDHHSTGHHDNNHDTRHDNHHSSHHGSNYNSHRYSHHGSPNNHHYDHHYDWHYGHNPSHHSNHHDDADHHSGHPDAHHGSHSESPHAPSNHDDQHHSNHPRGSDGDHDDGRHGNVHPPLRLPASGKQTQATPHGGSSHSKLDTVLSHLHHASPDTGAHKKPKNPDAFRIGFPMRTNYMYAKMTRSLVSEVFALTVCLWLRDGSGPGLGTPFSYSAPGQANELVLIEWGTNPMELLINDKAVTLPMSLTDGKWHHVCVTWSTRDGLWEAYQDGVKKGSGENLSAWHSIKPGGIFIMGQEQDTMGGRFDATQSFVGDMSDLQFWSRVLTPNEIYSQASCGSHLTGDVISWSESTVELHGGVAKYPFDPCH